MSRAQPLDELEQGPAIEVDVPMSEQTAIEQWMASDESEDMSPEEAEARLSQMAHLPEHKREEILNEIRLSQAIQRRIKEIARENHEGVRTWSWPELAEELSKVAAEFGHLNGIAMPAFHDEGTGGSVSANPLVMAKGSPLAQVMMLNQARTELEGELQHQRESVRIRNSWTMLADSEIALVDGPKGTRCIKRPLAGRRLRNIFTEIGIRFDAAMTADAELRAIESLRTRVTESQFATYMLSGAFIETSTRSDLKYLFRKGRPTLVMSYHGAQEGRVIAALCWHPMAYYAFSHVGAMVPTDEIISALLAMRGDEHYFWRKSGQWHARDSRAGL